MPEDFLIFRDVAIPKGSYLENRAIEVSSKPGRNFSGTLTVSLHRFRGIEPVIDLEGEQAFSLSQVVQANLIQLQFNVYLTRTGLIIH